MKYALRGFARNPGFTSIVLVTLALGIGGSTSIFSVVYGVLLRPLPYPEPDGIVSVQSSRSGPADAAHTPADFLDLQREQRSFKTIAAYRGDVIDITSDAAAPERLDGTLVTSEFFDVFGVAAARPSAWSRTMRAMPRTPSARFTCSTGVLWKSRWASRRTESLHW